MRQRVDNSRSTFDLTRTNLWGSLLINLTGSIDLGYGDLWADDDDDAGLELVTAESALIRRLLSFFRPQSAFPALIASYAVSFPDKCAMEYPDARRWIRGFAHTRFIRPCLVGNQGWNDVETL